MVHWRKCANRPLPQLCNQTTGSNKPFLHIHLHSCQKKGCLRNCALVMIWCKAVGWSISIKSVPKWPPKSPKTVKKRRTHKHIWDSHWAVSKHACQESPYTHPSMCVCLLKYPPNKCKPFSIWAILSFFSISVIVPSSSSPCL